jgi:tetratricopeptide (TPR) repeat protein
MGQNMSAVGELIRRYRQRAGLSQSDLAGSDFSPSYVSLIESGKRQPSDEALIAFARRLGCPVEDLRQDTAQDGEAAVELELSYARLTLVNGEPAAARQRLGVVLARPGLNRRLEHDARLLLAEAQDKAGDLPGAIASLTRLYEASLAGRSHLTISRICVDLSMCCVEAGDFHAAVRYAEAGLRASTEAGLSRTEDHLKLQANLVLAQLELGDTAVALATVGELVKAAQEAGSPLGEAAAYWNAALVAESRGQLHEALHLSQRALGVLSEQGTTRNLARLQLSVAWFILCAEPDHAWQAAAILDGSRAGLDDLGSPTERAYWESNRSVAHLLGGESRQAERLARRALLHLQAAGDPLEAGQARINLGDALMAEGLPEQAFEAYRVAAERLVGLPTGWKSASLHRSVAYRLALAGDADGAMRAMDRALDAAGVRAQTASADVAFGRRPPVPVPSREETMEAVREGATAGDSAADGTAAGQGDASAERVSAEGRGV